MGRKSNLILASVFLSHSNQDKKLVEKLACELVQRGIIPWLDTKELSSELGSLDENLKKSVQNQSVFLAFLSKAAIKSSWMENELTTAIKMEEKNQTIIIPIFLGNPEELVKSHPLLSSRWLDPDGDKVDRLGITIQDNQTNNDFNINKIADLLALKIYEIHKFYKQKEIIIYLNQRNGRHLNIQENVNRLNIPALVFRPNLDENTQNDVIIEKQWKALSQKIIWSLRNALDNTKWTDQKKIRIMGESQLALPFLLGHYFNRNTSANLYCYNSASLVFTNKEQKRYSPLENGNSHCESEHKNITPIPHNFKGKSIALFLMRKHLVEDALKHWKNWKNEIIQPCIWIDNGDFETNTQVMDYVSDVVALLVRLKKEHKIKIIYLYTSLPFAVLPILSANLLHVIDKIIFMEFRKDLQEKYSGNEKMYIPLSIKR